MLRRGQDCIRDMIDEGADYHQPPISRASPAVTLASCPGASR
jgi:hypothetical protein